MIKDILMIFGFMTFAECIGIVLRVLPKIGELRLRFLERNALTAWCFVCTRAVNVPEFS